MAIIYTNITNDQKLEVANILSKIEAIDGALANIQTQRATAEITYTEKEQALKAEKNKLREGARTIRTAEIV